MMLQAPKVISEITFNNVIFKTFLANIGEGLPKHDHSYAHLTFCYTGRCLVRKEGKEKIVTPADPPLYLTAGEWHSIEALENNTTFQNVFSVQ